MRIVIVNQFYLPDLSPTAHLAASLAEHRAAGGDNVTVVTSFGGYVGRSEESSGGEFNGNLRIVRVWTPQLGKRRKLFRVIDYGTFYTGAIAKLALLPAQDAVISLTTPPFIAIAGLVHKLIHGRARLILWNMDCYPEIAERTGVLKPAGLLSRLMRWLNRRLFIRLDHLVTLDSAMEHLLLSQYAPRQRHLARSIIPNWERASFFPAAADHPQWQPFDELGLRDRVVILYSGNAGYGHHFDTVIEAAAVLRNDPVTFLFVGGGSRWEEIRVAASERGLDNIVLYGYVPKEQTPSVMKAASCALITLQDFALGVMSPSKLHSNLAMALPVIYVGPLGSNVDDAIKAHGCGVSLRVGDVDGVVRSIRQMVNSPAVLADMCKRARAAFESSFCDSRALPSFDAVIDQSDVAGCVAPKQASVAELNCSPIGAISEGLDAAPVGKKSR